MNMRKTYLINPRFQLKFSVFLLAISSLATVLFYASNLWFFWKFRTLGATFGLPANHAFFTFISQQESMMNHIFVVTAIVLVLVIFMLGTLFSHRIAGPLHRLSKHLAALSSGSDMKDLHFRKSDFFPEIATHLNGFLKRVRQENRKN